MPDLVSDGMIRVYYVPTIANIAAPTTTELNAGTALQLLITADGLDKSWQTAEVDTAALGDTFDTANVGRRKPTFNLTLKRQTGTDTVFNTLVYGATGFIAVRDNILATTAWASAQALEVWPVAFGQANKANAPNTIQRYTVPVFVTLAPSLAAAVA